MKRRWLRMAVAVAGSCVVVAGCGSASTDAGSGPQPGLSGSSASPSPPDTKTYSVATPSPNALQICSEEEIENAITLSLGLNGPPKKSGTWVSPVYSCTYRLTEGPFNLSVTEFVTDAAAVSAFKQVRSQFVADKAAIQTLDNFGVPAFLAADDVVVTVKDNKMLRVDATQLPKIVGPQHRTRRDLGYLVAEAILRCWSGQ